MMLVDKETGKGYVEMEKVHRDKKEYASKAVGGTALGLSIGALGLQLLGGGLLNCGLFGNRATVAETAAIAGTAANEHYLERKQCADQVQELINSVRDKVANSPRGKELLEKQLNNIRAKKDSIIEEANKELELFKKFQIAAQANPKLTYVDFCNNIKNKEV